MHAPSSRTRPTELRIKVRDYKKVCLKLSAYRWSVDWGDGSKNRPMGAEQFPDYLTHEYRRSGEYTIRIFGSVYSHKSLASSDPLRDDEMVRILKNIG